MLKQVAKPEGSKYQNYIDQSPCQCFFQNRLLILEGFGIKL